MTYSSGPDGRTNLSGCSGENHFSGITMYSAPKKSRIPSRTASSFFIAAVYIFALLTPLQLLGQSCTTATCTAASTSEAAVLAALPSPGNTNATVVVNIPTGTSAWSSALINYTLPSAVTNLTIHGNTSCTGSGDPALNNMACTDHTIIQDSAASSGVDLISFTVPTGHFLRITGMTFAAGSRSVADHGTLVVACTDDTTGNGQLRYDHNHSSGVSTFMSTEDCFGVADHNKFVEAANNLNYLHIWNLAYNQGFSAGFGDGSWAANTDYGTMKFFYVEANSLDNGIDDCTFGGRAVVRFNTMTNGSSVQTHPTGGGGADERGCRAYEIYQNNMSTPSPASPSFNGFFMSSGTAMVWNNTTLNYSNVASIHSMRRDNSTYSESPTPGGWGYCGTDSSLPGAGSAWDQNTPTTTGYACIDQPGRGKGDLITGQMPSAINSTTGTIHWTNEALDPVYEWNETKNCSGCGGSYWANYEPSVLTQNKDFYLGCNPASQSGCTSFTGATGVGWGLRSARSATCTTGVGWFSTDQGSWNSSGNGAGSGVFDKCTSTNAWTNATYTPFAYPHPLTGGSSTFTLSTATAGTGSGTIGSCAGIYSAGDAYSCVVTPSAGSTISTVTGCGGSGASTYAGTMPAADCTVTATFQGTVQTPTFSPSTLSTPGFVTVASATSGATCFYTTNGTTPTSASTRYVNNLYVASNPTTIKAMCTKTGYADSGVGTSSAYAPTVTPKFYISVNSASDVPTPFPGVNRVGPGAWWKNLLVSPATDCNTYNWAPLDAYITTSEAHGSPLMLYTFEEVPQCANGTTNSGNPPTDIATGNVFFKNFVDKFYEHICGLSAIPSSPVSYTTCHNFKYGETWNEPNVGRYWTSTDANMGIMWTTVFTEGRKFLSDGVFSGGAPSAGGKGNEYYYTAELAILQSLGDQKPDVLSFHPYPSRTNVFNVPFPDTIVSNNDSTCTGTPNVSCDVSVAGETDYFRQHVMQDTSVIAWAGKLGIITTEGGYGVNDGVCDVLDGDWTHANVKTLRGAYVAQWMVALQDSGTLFNLAYVDEDQSWMTFTGNGGSSGATHCTIPAFTGKTAVNAGFNQMLTWLNSGTPSGPKVCTGASTFTMTCTLPMTIGGNPAEIKYYTGWLTSHTQSTAFTSYQDLQGATHAITGGTFPNSQEPVLLTGGTAGTANTPIPSPGAGSYGASQSVTLATTSSGAIICYNTTGSPATNLTTGCTTGTLYSGAITVASSETLYFVAGGTGYTDSAVGSAAYVINGAASTPTFSPVAGSYGPAQSVTISSSTSGATLCYTVDGSTPTANGSGTCTHGTTYVSAITVSVTQTIKAVASKAGFLDSTAGSATYTINGPVAVPVPSPAAGTYFSTQSVTLTDATGSATICYTVDGSTPTASAGTCAHGTTYSTAISVSTTTTIKALGSKSGFSDSTVLTALYTISAPPTVHVTLSGTQTFSGTGKVQ